MISPGDSMVETWKRMGDTYRINIVLFGDEYVVTKPENIREVLTDDETFVGGRANTMLEPVVGASSILLLDGREHARERKLLMPPFHGDRMKTYTAAMRDAVL